MHKKKSFNGYTYPHQRYMKNWGMLQDDEGLKIGLNT